MKAKLAILFVILALVSMPVLTVAAQGGEGGILIEGNSGGDPPYLNPVVSNDTASSDVHYFLFPDLIKMNVDSGTYEPNQRNSLAESWEVSDDSLVYTFHLRDDLFWSDGVPITSEDYKYGFDAVASGVVDTPRISVLAVMESVEAPDPYTVVVTMSTNECNALDNVDDFGVIPAHAWRAEIGDDFSLMNEADFNINPTATYGPFNFFEFRAGEQVSLVANENYPDALLGYVSPTGWIYKSVPDQTIMVEQFLAGETNVLRDPQPERMEELQNMADAGEIEFFQFPQSGYTWMAYNLADPTNPQNGLDEDGNIIDQGHHPLFGDVRVRQALAHAVDVDSIMDGAIFGHGSRMVSAITPTSWAFNDQLEPYAYDPDLALEMLNEAGWRDEDGDGILEAHGALYAEDGTPFSFSLNTNADNALRVATGTIIQDQLGQLGIEVDFQGVEFSTLVGTIVGQEFDAIILGWNQPPPADPDQRDLFTAAVDVPGGGFNFTSFYNEEMEEVMDIARTMPGCRIEDRKPYYDRMQEILYEEQPYMFLFAPDRASAVQAGIEGFDPRAIDDPLGAYWNVDTWTLAP